MAEGFETPPGETEDVAAPANPPAGGSAPPPPVAAPSAAPPAPTAPVTPAVGVAVPAASVPPAPVVTPPAVASAAPPAPPAPPPPPAAPVVPAVPATALATAPTNVPAALAAAAPGDPRVLTLSGSLKILQAGGSFKTSLSRSGSKLGAAPTGVAALAAAAVAAVDAANALAAANTAAAAAAAAATHPDGAPPRTLTRQRSSLSGGTGSFAKRPDRQVSFRQTVAVSVIVPDATESGILAPGSDGATAHLVPQAPVALAPVVAEDDPAEAARAANAAAAAAAAAVWAATPEGMAQAAEDAAAAAAAAADADAAAAAVVVPPVDPVAQESATATEATGEVVVTPGIDAAQLALAAMAPHMYGGQGAAAAGANGDSGSDVADSSVVAGSTADGAKKGGRFKKFTASQLSAAAKAAPVAGATPGTDGVTEAMMGAMPSTSVPSADGTAQAEVAPPASGDVAASSVEGVALVVGGETTVAGAGEGAPPAEGGPEGNHPPEDLMAAATHMGMRRRQGGAAKNDLKRTGSFNRATSMARTASLGRSPSFLARLQLLPPGSTPEEPLVKLENFPGTPRIPDPLAPLGNVLDVGALFPPTRPPVATKAKEKFLATAGEAYGYGGVLDRLRVTDFHRLHGTAYLDHAGATLYSEPQLRNATEQLCRAVLPNPHSYTGNCFLHSAGSPASAALVDDARNAVLAMCNAPVGEYVCIFTAGATAALKMLAEAFPWDPASKFWYTEENHNSVVGMREAALAGGASAAAVSCKMQPGLPGGDPLWEVDPLKGREMRRGDSTDPPPEPAEEGDDDGPKGESLFAFPLECNFTGHRMDLRVVRAAQTGVIGLRPWRVLIDGAKGAATDPPDLTSFPADFVALSFYKIFGYPSGLGCLIARVESLPILRRQYFGGGTVAAVAAGDDFKGRRAPPAGMEDGTLPYLAIAALAHGFTALGKVGGFRAIASHTAVLRSHLLERLNKLDHANGAPVVAVLGGGAWESDWGGKVGPTVTFLVLRADGSFVGHREVERLCALRGVVVRGGTFCNPGAAAKALSLTLKDVKRAAGLASDYDSSPHEGAPQPHASCWDELDLYDGRPMGAVRASLGYASTYEDVAALVAVLRDFFLEPCRLDASAAEAASEAALAAEPGGTNPLLPRELSHPPPTGATLADGLMPGMLEAAPAAERDLLGRIGALKAKLAAVAAVPARKGRPARRVKLGDGVKPIMLEIGGGGGRWEDGGDDDDYDDDEGDEEPAADDNSLKARAKKKRMKAKAEAKAAAEAAEAAAAAEGGKKGKKGKGDKVDRFAALQAALAAVDGGTGDDDGDNDADDDDEDDGGRSPALGTPRTPRTPKDVPTAVPSGDDGPASDPWELRKLRRQDSMLPEILMAEDLKQDPYWVERPMAVFRNNGIVQEYHPDVPYSTASATLATPLKAEPGMAVGATLVIGSATRAGVGKVVQPGRFTEGGVEYVYDGPQPTDLFIPGWVPPESEAIAAGETSASASGLPDVTNSRVSDDDGGDCPRSPMRVRAGHLYSDVDGGDASAVFDGESALTAGGREDGSGADTGGVAQDPDLAAVAEEDEPPASGTELGAGGEPEPQIHLMDPSDPYAYYEGTAPPRQPPPEDVYPGASPGPRAPRAPPRLRSNSFYVWHDVPAPLRSAAWSPPPAPPKPTKAVTLDALYIYPIKSAGAYRPARAWPIAAAGLVYDREWVLLDLSGHPMTQKRHPQLCTLRPVVYLARGFLKVSAPKMAQALQISLTELPPAETTGDDGAGKPVLRYKGTGDPVTVYPRAVNEWFSRALGTACYLGRAPTRAPAPSTPLRKKGGKNGGRSDPAPGEGDGDDSPPGSWANEAPVLAVTAASVQELNRRMQADAPAVTPDRFRPNLVLSGSAPFEEDGWEALASRHCELRAVGPCGRCDMVCVDQVTGARLGSEPLLALAAFRRSEGKLFFGLLLRPQVSDEGSVVAAAAAARGPREGAVEDENWMRERWGTVLCVGQALETLLKPF